MGAFHDLLGQVSNIYEGTSQISTAQLIQSTFDNRGLIDTMQRSTVSSGFLTDFSFDSIGRLSSLFQDAAGTANDLTIGQSFNPAGQIAGQTRSNDAYAWQGSVAVNRNYTTNGLNQYTAAGPASFTYDANGNLTSDGSTSFVYDIENRLVSASGANIASLAYDPMGRLWQVTGPTSDTRFVYDSDELAAEYDAAGTMARRYVHSDNVDDPVVQYDGATVGAAARTFLMPDERGSIVGLIYNDGTSRAINSYDEYGIPGSGNQGRFQYTGQVWIPELGMYHYKGRLYSPTLGRFLQVDPIGYEGGIALYAYVGDDPVNMVDPTGEQGCADAGQGAQNGLGGVCVDSSNYNTAKDSLRTVVSTPQIDQSARVNMPSIANDAGPKENIAQFDQKGSDVTFTPLSTTTGEGANTTQGRATPIGSPDAIDTPIPI